ncbi:MAG: hypothetical protein A3J74_06935 [Elusimicrobia bacterium RIFCSPHIGHO2_02_FULL_57_9]|nr:MAG: hypothetical protein A3J74_06935 [Elusimicrobia bacterium RIFCSPHIGHO2_02_FULL_57_9]
MIADGAGEGLLAEGRLLKGATGALEIDRLSDSGLVRTYSGDSLITDSAAAATAMATGVKTKNGALGVDADGRRLQTLLELAKKAGKSAGLITTASLADATPAAFASHVSSRYKTEEIAAQILAAKPDVLLGGGRIHFPAVSTSATVDFFAHKEMFPALYGDNGPARDMPSLRELTDKALAILSKNPRGFFLLVEEEGTDNFLHEGKAASALKALAGFDAAVKTARGFAGSRDDTLLLVTSDHETGGVAVLGTGDGYSSDPALACPAASSGPFLTPAGRGFCLGLSTRHHSGAPVRIAASGPGCAAVRGLIDNTEIFSIIRRALQ